MDNLNINFKTIVSNQIDSIRQTLKEKEMSRLTDQLRETITDVILNDAGEEVKSLDLESVADLMISPTVATKETSDSSQITEDPHFA